jgi:hypothetical protein
MAADQGARLRGLRLRRSDHQHDRGRERDHRQRIMGGRRKPFHGADGDRTAKARHRPREDIAAATANDCLGRHPQPIQFHLE